jgi:hypothetical protein
MVVTLESLKKDIKALKSKKKESSSIGTKVSSKDILKGIKPEVHIQNKEPAKYVPIYFKAEINEAKKSAFFDD